MGLNPGLCGEGAVTNHLNRDMITSAYNTFTLLHVNYPVSYVSKFVRTHIYLSIFKLFVAGTYINFKQSANSCRN